MPLGEFELEGDGGSIWASLHGGGERRTLSASALRRRFDGRWRATGHREDETGSSSFRTLPQHKSLRPVLVGGKVAAEEIDGRKVHSFLDQFPCSDES